MGLKYSFTELFRGKFPSPKLLYDLLEDLQRQIVDGADAVPIVRNNVKLTKTALKKEFGDPKKFVNIAVVHNTEGSYLVVSDSKEFKIIALENL